MPLPPTPTPVFRSLYLLLDFENTLSLQATSIKLSEPNTLSLSNNKNFRLKESGVFPLQ